MAQFNLPVPRIDANEDEVRIIEWHASVGDLVLSGQSLVTVETTKTAVDVTPERDGYLRWCTQPEDELARVGSTLAIFSEEIAEPIDLGVTAPAPEQRRVTLKARLLAERLGIDLNSIPGNRIDEAAVAAVARGITGVPHSETYSLSLSDGGSAAVIVGDGRHASYVLDVVQRAATCRVVGCTSPVGSDGAGPDGLKVLGTDDILAELYADGVSLALVGIGSERSGKRTNLSRARVFDMLKQLGFYLPVVIDPDASISATARIGEGTIVGAKAVVSSHVRVGRNCIVNVGAIVCHDVRIGDHVHITPGAVVAGGVTVGDGSTIGMASTIADGVHVGKDCLVPNGYRVIADLCDGAVAPKV